MLHRHLYGSSVQFVVNGSAEARSPFGAALRALRLLAGLSQEQLAERARMSTDGVGALERGTRRAPYRETVDLLADAVEASPAQRAELHGLARRPRRLPGAPAPEPSKQTTRHNLPYEGSRLVGRGQVLSDLHALVAHRLVTICGSGGIGKTRVALALARGLVNEGSLDEVVFISLEALTSGDLVAATAARALGVAQSGDASLETAMLRALGERRVLLVFDNCEHVADATARFISAVLAATSNAGVLTTSRKPLGIAGEAVYRLPSLEVPKPADELRAAEALTCEAVALFVERASMANPSFELTDEAAPLVADICRRLDGIALAIELAAARVKALSPASLARHLEDRFRLLTAGNSRAMRRQRTLSAMIDWSYDLLSPDERTTLNRVAYFAGGFDLEAAHAVCAAGEGGVYDVLDLLTQLIDQSLVIAETTHERERFRLLESTRAYALERLDADDDRATVAQRHAGYYARMARRADATYGAVTVDKWLPPLEAETDNFRLACDWAVAGGNDVSLGGEIAGALERFWINSGLEPEGRRRIKGALDRIDERAAPAAAARLWRALAWLELSDRKLVAARKASGLYESLGDDAGLADSLRQVAIATFQMGDLDASKSTNARALGIFRSLGDRRNIANCLDIAGAQFREDGDFAAAAAALDEALALFRSLGSDGGVASILTQMSEVQLCQGNVRRGAQLLEEASVIHKRGKSLSNLARDAMTFVAVHTLLGDYHAAYDALLTAIDRGQATGNADYVASALLYASAMFALTGEVQRAVRLNAFASAERERLNIKVDTMEGRTIGLYETAVRAVLDAAEIECLAAEGATWSVERALSEATKIPQSLRPADGVAT